MWLAIFRHALGLSSAFSVGWSIRLLDDALDQELDRAVGRPNLCSALQGGTTAYALAALALAVLADQTVAVSLFAGAYAIGMTRDVRLLPTGLPAWLEGALLFLLTLARVGWRPALAGALIMASVQLLDDCRDTQIDRFQRKHTYGQWLGPIGACLVAVTAFYSALYLQAELAIYALPVFLYFEWRERVVTRHVLE